MKYQSIIETIGNTDHVLLKRIFPQNNEVWLKLERQNPGGSIKDRVALSMIEDAERKGIIASGATIIEPTSGNTGIGLAMVGAVKGYKVILVMPESMSIERRKLMTAYGAKVVLTPKEGGMKASISRAKSLLGEIPGSWMPSQFDNPANIEAHINNTAKEIIKDFPDGFDYFVSGVGTGGHLSGCAAVLKKEFPKMEVIAVEPFNSAVISGEKAGPHKIQGIGAGFIPGNLKTDLIDDVISVKYEDAVSHSALCAKKEGILLGISSGAVLAAASTLVNENKKIKILLFNYDTGERYLSVPEMFE
jgi:cysteine synthase A